MMAAERGKDGNEEGRVFETPAKPLPAAALRALEEASARRKALTAAEAAMPKEIGGRGGREPVRYGDWEIKGKAVDF